MATDVPGVLHIGGGHAQGGQTGTTSLVNTVKLDLNNVAGFNLPRSDLQNVSDRRLMQVTPHSISDGASMAVASGAHIWYDRAAQSGNINQVESFVAGAVTLPAATLTSGVHNGDRLTFIDATGGSIGIYSGWSIDGLAVCTGNTDQVLFFNSADHTPHVAQGFWIGEGRFTDYHPAAGFLTDAEALGGAIARRGGSTVVQANHGVGPDSTYVPDFFDKVWNTAPYFHAAKHITTSTLVGNFGDSPNDALRTNFTNDVTQIEAAAAERGNTIKWEVVIIDLVMNDLETGGTTSFTGYQAQLEEFIDWLRSASGLNNSALKIILVNHRNDMWNVTGQIAGVLGAPFYRTFHNNVAANKSNVGIVDMRDRRIADVGDSPNVATNERKYYAQQEYFWMGEEIVRVYQRLVLGTATDQSGGFPVYMYVGDSIAVGQISSTWTTQSYSIELTGETVGDLTRPNNQLIYVRATSTLEIYTPHTNSNPSGHATTNASSDLSIMAELGKLHPDGFAMIKRGSSSSGLAATASVAPFSGLTGYEVGGRWHKDYGEHWPEIVDEYSGAMQYINNTLGKQGHLRAIFVTLGHNDHAAEGGAQLFVDKFGSFIDDLHATFGTDTSPKKAHILWRRPQTDTTGVTLSGMVLVRTAIENRAASDDYFHLLDVDGRETDHRDGLHESPETAVLNGRDWVQLLSGAWVAGF